MPTPFISAADLTAYLGRDVSADAGATIAIDYACDTVRAISEQDINQSTDTVYLNGTGTDALLLPQLPVTAAGTVVVNGGTVTDYLVNSDWGTLYRTAGTYRGTWPKGRQNIQVNYTHGYGTADVPREIRGVALAIAARYIVQGVAISEIGRAHV